MVNEILFVIFLILAIVGISSVMLGIGLVLGQLMERYTGEEEDGEE